MPKTGRTKLPEGEKKHPIWVFVQKSEIDYFGGKEALKEFILNQIKLHKK